MTTKEVEGAIKEFHDLDDKIARLAETKKSTAAEMYHGVAKDVIGNDDGELEHEKLDNEDVAKEFANKLIEKYLDRAQEYLNTDFKDLDDIKKEEIFRLYTGTTTKMLKDQVKQSGRNYTIDTRQNSALLYGK